jgi:hypothetical protein
MKLNPPTTIAFWASVVLAALGLLGLFVAIPFVSGFAFWFVVVGYLVLLISLFVKGM